MKKIMLAMMATVGLAFFAKADGTTYPGSTDFEGEEFVVGNGLPDTDKGSGAETAAFWANYQDAVGESKIVAGGPNGSTKYASLDTENKVLLRQAEAGTPVSFGSIYFDTMVQFTASEGDIAVSTNDEDKLVIWLQSNEASEGTPASTNLMIRAAELNPIDYHKTGSQDYTVVSATPFEAGKWYRLTVKTYADISGLQGVSCPGFEVYIDGTKVSVTGADLYNGYFASLVAWDSIGAGELTGIGFQGTGAVDNIVMTSEDPFPPEATYTLAVTIEDENEDLAAITVNGTEYLINGQTSLEIPFLASTKTLEVAASDIFEGMMIKEWNGVSTTITVADELEDGRIALTLTVVEDARIDVENATVIYSINADTIKVGDAAPTVTSVTVNETELTLDTDYTVTSVGTVEAVGEYKLIIDGKGAYKGQIQKTFTVQAAGPDVPTEDEAPAGGSATVQAESEEAALTAVTVKVDDAVAAVLTPEQKAAFVASFFTKSVFDNQDGTYTVSVAVNGEAVEAKLDEVVAEALETAAAGEITKIPAGLCYKIESGSTVGLGTVAKGVSTGATIEVKGLTEAAGFYKVSLDVAPIAE